MYFLCCRYFIGVVFLLYFLPRKYFIVLQVDIEFSRKREKNEKKERESAQFISCTALCFWGVFILTARSACVWLLPERWRCKRIRGNGPDAAQKWKCNRKEHYWIRRWRMNYVRYLTQLSSFHSSSFSCERYS